MELVSQGDIGSVEEALTKVTKLIEGQSAEASVPDARRRFGFWFRGQIAFGWRVSPSVYRSPFDEDSMGAHFRMLRPEYHSHQASDFDWLSLMQHHGLPTRLVDWTENLLVGLFFSTWVEERYAQEAEQAADDKGALFILAARKLNAAVIGSSAIAIPNSFHAVARAVLARSKTDDAWLRQMKAADFSGGSTGAERFDEIMTCDPAARARTLAGPIAIFPSRRDDRLVAQAGAFTLHGGKPYPPYGGLSAPDDLIDLNSALEESRRFVWKFQIVDKQRIRKQLKLVGIHQGTLFPDLDHQSLYLRELWAT